MAHPSRSAIDSVWSDGLVLVANCGSSSLKFTILPVSGETPIVAGVAERLGVPDAQLVVKADGTKSVVAMEANDHAAALSGCSPTSKARICWAKSP
ncbi:hypothetical protein [Roseiarcus sp.]|uniref:hypothetical protein n=1 Tax=Roseiarcus sp. TaxID=1969460 RepID=UPI003F9653AE